MQKLKNILDPHLRDMYLFFEERDLPKPITPKSLEVEDARNWDHEEHRPNSDGLRIDLDQNDPKALKTGFTPWGSLPYLFGSILWHEKEYKKRDLFTKRGFTQGGLAGRLSNRAIGLQNQIVAYLKNEALCDELDSIEAQFSEQTLNDARVGFRDHFQEPCPEKYDALDRVETTHKRHLDALRKYAKNDLYFAYREYIRTQQLINGEEPVTLSTKQKQLNLNTVQLVKDAKRK